MMYRFQIQKYILSEVFRVYKPQEPLTFEPYLHVGMTFKKFDYFLNKKGQFSILCFQERRAGA